MGASLAVLLFLYRHVLETPFGWLDGLVRAKRGHRRPTVLSRGDVRRVLSAIEGSSRPIAHLLYGSGLRISEACSLRVKDLDFERREILVRAGKGDRDRLTMLPDALVVPSRNPSKRWAAASVSLPWPIPLVTRSVSSRTRTFRCRWLVDFELMSRSLTKNWSCRGRVGIR